VSIWRVETSVEALAAALSGTADTHLGMRLEALGPDWISGSLPVDERTRQPAGLLHGGVTCVLAESLGSIGASLCVDPATHYCVGIEINANHLRGVREGRVTGEARPLHVGKSTQVWDIRVADDGGRPVAVSRLTLAVLEGPFNPMARLAAPAAPGR
jgi:uncharacterized protein (TIGR00369 family)